MLHSGDETNDIDAKPRDAAIGRSDFAGSDEPIDASNPSVQSFRTRWGEMFLMVLVFSAGAIGLFGFSIHVTRQDRELEPANRPGAGIIVRSEPIHLWLPQALAELAQRQSQSPVVRTHEELRRFLETEDRQDLWYARTTRGHQVNGEVVDITVIRRPYDDPIHFSELLDVVATAAGKPPRDPEADYSEASVHILAQELLKREPREVMAELLGHPVPTLDRERLR
jgi:hypothetical protein